MGRIPETNTFEYNKIIDTSRELRTGPVASENIMGGAAECTMMHNDADASIYGADAGYMGNDVIRMVCVCVHCALLRRRHGRDVKWLTWNLINIKRDKRII